MHPGHAETISGTTQDERFVSGRFLSDLLGALERQDIPASGLLGDLPIPLDGSGGVSGSVEWDYFAEFMGRLGRLVGGASGLERCGETIGVLAPARALTGLAGLAASPHSVFRAASGWVLRRAMPGVVANLVRIDDNRFEIRARIADGLRACPEILHFAAGGARVLPRLIGLREAVVTAEIGEREALYRILVPPSSTLFAKTRRLFSAIFSAGSVLRFLEAQQLELLAKNDALERANAALGESERRYRAITDAAVDLLCEVDLEGRVLYVSASIKDLLGYSPEQVTGSHYRLWIPTCWHERADAGFEELLRLPEGRSIKQRVKLHAHGGEQVLAELTARTYRTEGDGSEGKRRAVCILRDLSDESDERTQRPLEPARVPATDEMSRVVERAMIRTETLAEEDAIESLAGSMALPLGKDSRDDAEAG